MGFLYDIKNTLPLIGTGVGFVASGFNPAGAAIGNAAGTVLSGAVPDDRKELFANKMTIPKYGAGYNFSKDDNAVESMTREDMGKEGSGYGDVMSVVNPAVKAGVSMYAGINALKAKPNTTQDDTSKDDKSVPPVNIQSLVNPGILPSIVAPAMSYGGLVKNIGLKSRDIADYRKKIKNDFNI